MFISYCGKHLPTAPFPKRKSEVAVPPRVLMLSEGPVVTQAATKPSQH